MGDMLPGVGVGNRETAFRHLGRAVTLELTNRNSTEHSIRISEKHIPEEVRNRNGNGVINYNVNDGSTLEIHNINDHDNERDDIVVQKASMDTRRTDDLLSDSLIMDGHEHEY